MAFDWKYLVAMSTNGYNTIYEYCAYNGSDGGEVGGVSGLLKGCRTQGEAGFFYDARYQLRVGDRIVAGVSAARVGGGIATAGVSRYVVTHVSTGSVAGVTIAGDGGK